MKISAVGAAVTLAAAVVACEDGGPAGFGRAQGLVKDPQTAAFTGTVSGNVQVSVSSDGSTWFDLASLNGIMIVLQSPSGDSTNVHGEQDAPAGSHSRARLRFSGVSANLGAGSTVGSTTLSSDAIIPLGGSDQEALIEKSVSFEVPSDMTLRRTIVFTLNSASWITESSLVAGVVEDAALESAVQVTTRVEPR